MKGIEYEGDDTLYQICVSETNFTKQQLMLLYNTCTVASLKELKSKVDTFILFVDLEDGNVFTRNLNNLFLNAMKKFTVIVNMLTLQLLLEH